ncbi:MAG: glycoside hydrolase family 92 protein, partial [Marinirhabdus sp.]|nr:glycoside hydrolase family 92 protein [Marinirhabdus sp.]
SLYAPQDISGHMALMGGKQAFENHLDTLFTATSKTSGRNQADITGLIGQYAHGNEPSHHMAYLYNYVNSPNRTQELIHQIVTELYSNSPDGISGNEDCGQMSAWYIFSTLGFYPVTPGSNQYIIGTPLFPKATIHLENGKEFTIDAPDVSDTHIYIASAQLNGKPLERSFLYHDEIISGGVLSFQMSDTPSNWGTADSEIPSTEILDHPILSAPFISEGDVVFKNETTIGLETTGNGTNIYYSLNDGDFQRYTHPIQISETTTVKTYAAQNDQKSTVLQTEFKKIDPNLSITLESEFANEYNAGGNDALIDGISGARDFRTGAWQGYQDQDVIAIVDIGSIKPIDKIKVNFLQDQGSWIFLPTEVKCYVSPSRGNFHKELPKVVFDSKTQSDSIKIETATFNMKNYSARYIKIVAKNAGALPEWHLGFPYDGRAWIFVDEIEIK